MLHVHVLHACCTCMCSTHDAHAVCSMPCDPCMLHMRVLRMLHASYCTASHCSIPAHEQSAVRMAANVNVDVIVLAVPTSLWGGSETASSKCPAGKKMGCCSPRQRHSQCVRLPPWEVSGPGWAGVRRGGGGVGQGLPSLGGFDAYYSPVAYCACRY